MTTFAPLREVTWQCLRHPYRYPATSMASSHSFLAELTLFLAWLFSAFAFVDVNSGTSSLMHFSTLLNKSMTQGFTILPVIVPKGLIMTTALYKKQNAFPSVPNLQERQKSQRGFFSLNINVTSLSWNGTFYVYNSLYHTSCTTIRGWYSCNRYYKHPWRNSLGPRKHVRAATLGERNARASELLFSAFRNFKGAHQSCRGIPVYIPRRG